MRDEALYIHILLGVLSIIFAATILYGMKKKASWVKPLSMITAAMNWLVLVPAGFFYINFYPATKTLIKAGAWPWAHSIFMETKEHWGLLLPVIATVAAVLVVQNRENESRRGWWLLIGITVAIGIMGRIVKMGALA